MRGDKNPKPETRNLPPMTITQTDILTTLATVEGLTGGTLVSENRISGITIRESNVGFILDSPPEHAGRLQVQCEHALLAFPGIERVTIVATAHSPQPSPSGRGQGVSTEASAQVDEGPRPTTGLSSSPFPSPASLSSKETQKTSRFRPWKKPPEAKPQEAPPAPPLNPSLYNKQPLPGVARIIAIGSGKGGVGKSSVTVLLAHALTAHGQRVAICDADIYGPSIPRMLGLPLEQPAITGDKMIPPQRHGIAANSMALLTGDSAAILRGPMVSKSLHQLLRSTDWAYSDTTDIPPASLASHNNPSPRRGEDGRGAAIGTALSAPTDNKAATPTPLAAPTPTLPLQGRELNFLLIDLPPGTGDVQLSLVQSLKIDGAIIVTTPQDISVIDARKAASMFRRTDTPLLGIIENMSGFTDPSGTTHALFGSGGGQTLADDFHIPLLAQLTFEPTIGIAMDKGQAPPVDSPVMQAMTCVAVTLVENSRY